MNSNAKSLPITDVIPTDQGGTAVVNNSVIEHPPTVNLTGIDARGFAFLHLQPQHLIRRDGQIQLPVLVHWVTLSSHQVF